jgi:hypothetical protein
MIGITEIIVIVLVIGIFFVFLRVPFMLRNKYPDRFWLGTLLSFLLGPFGHNYLPKSGWWVVALIFIFGIIKALTNDTNIAGSLTWILSGFVFIFRFRKKLKLDTMKRFLIMSICVAFLFGCGTHNLRAYKPLIKSEHSITVPPGGHALTGAIKDLLKKNNWTLYVDSENVMYQGESAPSIKITSKETFKTRYRLLVKSNQYDVCIPGGSDNPAVYYDISIVDNIDGDEVMNLSGQGCQSHIVEKFDKWLNNK